MNHIGTKTIETKRLSLRRFTMNDAPAMYQNWASEDIVSKYLTWPTHPNVTVTEQVLSEWMPMYQNDNYYHWAIELKEHNEPTGSLAVVKFEEQIDSAIIGYCIGSRWWNQGFVTEAYAAVIAFLFEEVRVNRIEARHDVHNPASGKVMQKCGMTCEGTLRQAMMNNQGVIDCAVYSILAQEYFERK